MATSSEPDRGASKTGLHVRPVLVKALFLLRRRQEARAASFQDRAAAAITRFAGSMIFVYPHAVLFGGWTLINVQVFPHLDLCHDQPESHGRGRRQKGGPQFANFAACRT